jgi:hypothetical protein
MEVTHPGYSRADKVCGVATILGIGGVDAPYFKMSKDFERTCLGINQDILHLHIKFYQKKSFFGMLKR